MKIIFAHSLLKREKVTSEKNELIQAYSKGIFTIIKGEFLPKYSQLIKIYKTTGGGAKRAVFLMDARSGDGFFLFYRSKNDQIGKNITIRNIKFKQTLRRYLILLKRDIQMNAYDQYEI